VLHATAPRGQRWHLQPIQTKGFVDGVLITAGCTGRALIGVVTPCMGIASAGFPTGGAPTIAYSVTGLDRMWRWT
jgi:hypothetical protein